MFAAALYGKNNRILKKILCLQNRGWVGAREGREADQAGGDRRVASSIEGVALRTVLRVIPQHALTTTREETSSNPSSTSSLIASQTLHVFPAAQQPAR